MNSEKYEQIKKDYCLLVNNVNLNSMSDTKEPLIISGESLTYNFNNGVVSFIDEKGIGYISPFYEMINTLEQAGYKQAGLAVPYTDNKWLNNGVLASRWKTLLEQQRKNKLENIDISANFNIEENMQKDL